MQLDDARGLIAALGNLPPELQAAGRRRVAERIAAEGVVDLAAGRVYRFKHGWIPLTHAAALRVTHGNHEKASALLAKHHGSDGSHTARVAPSKHGGFNVTHRGELQAHWNSEADAVKHAAQFNGAKASSARVAPSAHGGFNVIHKGKLQGNHTTQTEADRHAAKLNGTTRPKVRTSERTLASRQPASGRDKVSPPRESAAPASSRTRAEISTAATERAQGVAQDRHRRLEAERVGKEERRTLEQQGAVNAAKRARMESQGIRPAGPTGPDETPAAVRRREIVASMSDSQLEAAKARHDNPQTLRFIADEQAKRATAAPERNTRRAEHNQLAGFLANVGGPDTKAARAFTKAAEADRRRQDPQHQERLRVARGKRDTAARKKSEDAATQWAAGETTGDLQATADRGPRVINGHDYLHTAAVAELARRKARK